jgi:hypothetical protein
MTQNWFAVGLLFVLLISAASIAGVPSDGYSMQPATPLQAAFGTRASWSAVVTAQSDGYVDVPAAPSRSKICFDAKSDGWSDDQHQCTYFNDLFHSALTYQEFTDLSITRLASGPVNARGLVLKATGSYPTGNVHETAIWVYDVTQDQFRLVSALQSAEERILSSGPLDGYVITAAWQWQPGESRFGSDHFRRITAYKYVDDNGEGVYRKALEYITTEKYGAEDAHTIEREISTIAAKLGSTP